jgi:glycosyltransferase involved in cell wall biosynthesis
MKIVSPMCTGNGAYIVHKRLASHIAGYSVAAYHPYWTLCPPILPLLRGPGAPIIHTTPDHAIFFARKDARLVLTFHNYVLDRPMRSCSTPAQRIHYRTDLRLFTRLALRRADRVTAVSQATARLLRGDLGFAGPIEVVHNGVDIERFQPRSNGFRDSATVRVLFSGNPTRRKGAHWLAAIADGLHPCVRIVITGGLRPHIPSLRHPRIDQLGAVAYPAMPHLYRSVDVLLMPTIREGMSLAVLEAMASGIPVVASDTSSLPELIHHGKGGFLCGVGDVRSMSSAVNTLAEDAELRRRMGEYNRSLVESRFTESQMVDAYGHLFADLSP